MRLIILFFAVLVIGSTTGRGQGTSPTTLVGKSAVLVVSSGSGSFSSIGGYRISFSSTNATYTTTPLSSGIIPGAGTYVYTKIDANTARITVVDSTIGVGVTQALVFTSATTAAYSISSPYGAQTGTLVLENVTAVAAAGAGLINMSVRAQVPLGSQIIPGLVLDAVSRVLIRVSGPALAGFGVTGTLANPKLTVMSGNAALAANDDWSSTPANQAAVSSAGLKAGAFAFAPGSRDAALVIDLNPGAYTFLITGDSGTTGEVLVEVYRVP